MNRLAPLLTALVALACRDADLLSTQSSRGAPYITGMITERWDGGMFVVQNADPRFACDSTSEITFLPTVPIYGPNRTRADTSALHVGRKISVWVNTAIDASCPPGAGAGVIVLEN
ncbi:MAG TPA: hypothetical protein VLT79_10665 [Gemmatimonadales bacterium]|nr:hypothetical protein [Gemmatimonadales bacterium]